MKTKSISVIFAILISTTIFSQSYKTDSISKAEVSKLAFMVGNWEGSGWMIGQDRKKYEFKQTEHIQFKLDSTAILVEGLGKSDGEVIHNAMAIITYNKVDDNYRFQSYLQNGRSGEFKAEIKDGKLYWYPAENVQYVIWINDQGQWYEKGEFLQGDNAFQFFEMTLDKVSQE